MHIKASSFNCILLLGLMLLYLAQPALGLAGIIGPPVLLVIILISAVYLVRLCFSGLWESSVLTVWLLLLVYVVILYMVSLNANGYSELRDILLNSLPIFAFYYFAREGVLTEKTVKVFFCLLLIVFMCNMHISNSQLQIESAREEFTNNTAYHIMGLLPFVFLFRRRLLVLCLIMLLSLYAVGSMKRSVLIMCIMAAGIFVYGELYKDKSVYKVKGILLGLFFSTALLLIGLYYYKNIGLGEQFERRIQQMIYEGDSAGRDILIAEVFSAWVSDGNIFTYLFGLGYGASLSLTNFVTHNDFIKSIAEYGIVGFILFFALLSCLVLKVFNSAASDENKFSYAMFLLIMFMSALTSRWLGASFFYMNCVLLPYLLVFQKKRLND